MGSVVKVETGYRARWRTPEGASRSKTFRRKIDAENHVTRMESHKLTGSYVDPSAGKVAFAEYADRWLEAQTFDRLTREQVAFRFRLHVYPVLGRRFVAQIKPSSIQAWLRSLEALSPNYRMVIFANVSSVLNAAVDDDVIAKNPCQAPSVRRPKRAQSKIHPWSVERVARVIEELPERYGIVAVLGAGLGLRQGEIFGLSPDDVDFLRGSVEVRRQVRVHSDGTLEFNLPKGRKTRTVPLPGVVREAMAAHLARFPAEVVTLPWGSPDGPPTAVELVVSSREHTAVNRNYFNARIWKPALATAEVPTGRENGCHALRRHFASVLLDGGESIKALSEYLGHADAGFTLRTYTHLMPSSHERTKRAIDAAWSRVTGVSSVAK